MGVRLRSTLAIGIAGCISCTTFREADDPNVVGSTSSDAGDAGDAGQVVDGEVPGGPSNLVSNPGFEQGAVGCGPGWAVMGGILTRSSDGRTGGSSCELCPNPSTASSVHLHSLVMIDAKAGTYSVEAWLRAPSSRNASGATGVDLRFHVQGTAEPRIILGNTIVPGPTWQPSNHSVVLEQDGKLEVGIHVYVPNEGCVLVDDVALYAE